MALGFFRRRQKMVIIVMVALMVSFLVGFQGFQMLTSKNPKAEVWAGSNYGDVTRGELEQASNEVRLLAKVVGLGNLMRIMQQQWPTDLEFITFAADPKTTALSYIMLRKEAIDAGIEVSDEEIDAFFQQIGASVGSEGYRAIMARSEKSPGRTEMLVREALATWLKIMRHYSASVVNAPASETVLRRKYHDLFETIEVLAARVPADKFFDDVPEPSEEEIEALFAKYKGNFPRNVMEGPFGFGYEQRDKVEIKYLLIRQDVIARVARPSDSDARRYYLAHGDEFVRNIPLAGDVPATSTAPPEIPTEYRTEPMTFAQAKSEVIEKLKPGVAAAVLEGVQSQAIFLAQEYAKIAEPDQSVYEWVKGRMEISAKDILARKLSAVAIHQQPIAQAVQSLADHAGLTAICYPYGQSEEGELDPNVKVTVSADEITLGDALDQISKQVHWPQTDWAMCEGIGDVIFPTGEKVNLFPIQVGQTKTLTRLELRDDKLLSRCVNTSGQVLPTVAFQVEGLPISGEVPVLIKLDEEGGPMIVATEQGGRLLWRVSKAINTREPHDSSVVREQVIQDVKTLKAYVRAREMAIRLARNAQADGLDLAASRLQLDTETIGPIARHMMVSNKRQVLSQLMQGRMNQVQALQRIILDRPFRSGWSVVPTYPLPTLKLRERFVNSIFSLAPKNIEPAPQGEPYPAKLNPVTIVELPSLKQVLVIQRIDFRPAVTGEYEASGRRTVMNGLGENERWFARRLWFDWKSVSQRTGYQARRDQ